MSQTHHLLLYHHPTNGHSLQGTYTTTLLRKIIQITQTTHSTKTKTITHNNKNKSKKQKREIVDGEWYHRENIPILQIIQVCEEQGWRIKDIGVTAKQMQVHANMAVSNSQGTEESNVKAQAETRKRNRAERKKGMEMVNFVLFTKEVPVSTLAQYSVPINSLQYTKDTMHFVPTFLHKLVSYLSQSEALVKQNLFATSSDPHTLQALLSRIDAGEDINLHMYNPYTVANLLKLWIAKLPDKLLPLSSLQVMISAFEIPVRPSCSPPSSPIAELTQELTDGIVAHQNHSPETEKYTKTTVTTPVDVPRIPSAPSTLRSSLLANLGRREFGLLAYITRFFRLVASHSTENKLSAEKLSLIFGPLLIHASPLDESASELSVNQQTSQPSNLSRLSLSTLQNVTLATMAIQHMISEWETVFTPIPEWQPTEIESRKQSVDKTPKESMGSETIRARYDALIELQRPRAQRASTLIKKSFGLSTTKSPEMLPKKGDSDGRRFSPANLFKSLASPSGGLTPPYSNPSTNPSPIIMPYNTNSTYQYDDTSNTRFRTDEDEEIYPGCSVSTVGRKNKQPFESTNFAKPYSNPHSRRLLNLVMRDIAVNEETSEDGSSDSENGNDEEDDIETDTLLKDILDRIPVSTI